MQHKDFPACCKKYAANDMLHAANDMLHAANGMLHAANGMLHAANDMLHAANGMLHAACCNLQLHFTANFTEVILDRRNKISYSLF